jgi:hypothetical protein
MPCLLPALTLATLAGGAGGPAPAAPLSLAAELEAARPHAAAVAQDEPSEEWDFSYTFVEIGARRFNLDEIDDTADTYFGKASLGLFDFLYLFLGYENLSTDFENADTDLWQLGAGVHFDVAPRLDLTADIAWLRSDLSSDSFDETSNGHQLRAGARWMPIPFASGGLEIEGHGIWVDLDDSYLSDNSVLGFDIGARLHFLKFLSVGAYYEMLDKDDSASINARFSF